MASRVARRGRDVRLKLIRAGTLLERDLANVSLHCRRASLGRGVRTLIPGILVRVLVPKRRSRVVVVESVLSLERHWGWRRIE